ncbi:MAG TPA: hypothetical protein VIX73_00815 [Kofleriaceae bacterium]
MTIATPAATASASGPTASASAAPAAAFLGHVDAQRAALEVLAVELRERFLGAGRIGHLDKRKAARLTAVAVGHHRDREHLSAFREVLVDQDLGGVKGKIADIQTIRHFFAPWLTANEYSSFVGDAL